jgi:TonB family protein
LALAAVADAAPQMIQPTSKWTVNFDEAQCVASRNYGTPARPLYLMLKQPPVGDVMQLAMVEGGSASAPAQYEGKLTLGATQPIDVSVLRFQPKGAKMRTYLVNLSTDQFASAVRAPNVRLEVPQLDRNVALADMAPLVKVMNDCVADLRKTWNIGDPRQERDGLDEGAKGDLRKLFRADDYPVDALMEDQSGTVTAALLIDERGKVADCSVVGTSGAAALDAQTCFVFKERARFKPAVGSDGKPRKDGYIQRITWMTLFDLPEPTRIRR